MKSDTKNFSSKLEKFTLFRNYKILDLNIKKVTYSKIYFVIFYIAIFGIYVFYYGGRDQVDFTAFYRAVNLWTNGLDPYDRNYPFYFLNAPSTLIFISPLSLFSLETASVLYRLFILMILIKLCLDIKKQLKLDIILILSVLVLSTPVRTTFGSGLGGILILYAFWHLIYPIIRKKYSKFGIRESMLSLIILSFKPYLFLGFFVLFLINRKYQIIGSIITLFLGVNLCLSYKYPLLKNWLENMKFRSSNLTKEEGASSYISIINRLLEFLVDTSDAWVISGAFFVFINGYVLTRAVKEKDSEIQIIYCLILTMTAGIYINHRDYIAQSIILLLLFKKYGNFKNFDTLVYLTRCGLLTGSWIFQILASAFEPKKRPKLFLIILIAIPSFISAYNSQNNFSASALIYDINIQSINIFLLILLSKFEKNKIN